MKKLILTLSVLLTSYLAGYAQTNPAITAWLQNSTGITGRHYVAGNSTPITDAVLANVQLVRYSANNVYVTTNGIPAYITGPFQDRNPSLATTRNGLVVKLPLSPARNTGTATATTGGNIGLFINGVALFDYRDGVSWSNASQANAGGPSGGRGDRVWNRDAIIAEKAGFDCAKAHPAMGNYHHHQNPSAFNLDLVVLSTVCSTYPSDGLYVINPNQHSPLIGFAYDGFPIYGAYGYANADGTGGIVRMKSSYQLRNITARTTYASGATVTAGPPVNTTYPLGYYREDYEYVSHAGDASYLDVHNGRFCITPEYPNGIYCYFATVDSNHNSAYPYVVGPTFYGNVAGGSVTSVSETVTTYSPNAVSKADLESLKVSIYPNPAQDFIAVQTKMPETYNRKVELVDEAGKVVLTNQILQGSTLCILPTDELYNGIYFVTISAGKSTYTQKVVINR